MEKFKTIAQNGSKVNFLTAVDLVTRTADREIYAVLGILPQIQVSYCVPGAPSPPTTRLTISLTPAWKTRGKKNACSTRYVESILMIKSYLLFSFTGRQFTEVPQTVSRPWNKVLWGRYSNRTLNISPFSSVPCPLYAPHASGHPLGAHRTLHPSVVCVKRQRSGLYME